MSNTINGPTTYQQVINQYDFDADKMISSEEIEAIGGYFKLGETMNNMGPIDRYNFFNHLEPNVIESYLSNGNSIAALYYQRIARYTPNQMVAYRNAILQQFDQMDPGDQAIIIKALKMFQGDSYQQIVMQMRNVQDPFPFEEIPAPGDPESIENILYQFDTGEVDNRNWFQKFIDFIKSIFGIKNDLAKAGDLQIDVAEMKEWIPRIDEEILKLGTVDRVAFFVHMHPDAQLLYLQETSLDMGLVFGQIMDLNQQEMHNPPQALMENFSRLSSDQQQIMLWYMETNYDPFFVSALQSRAKDFTSGTTAPVGTTTQLGLAEPVEAATPSGDELDVEVEPS